MDTFEQAIPHCSCGYIEVWPDMHCFTSRSDQVHFIPIPIHVEQRFVKPRIYCRRAPPGVKTMSPFKKLLSNIKSTKHRESQDPEPFAPSNLARSNARLFKKRNRTHETLSAVQSAVNVTEHASSTTAAGNAAPIFLKDSSRSYSFEPGASVENFEAELEVHAKRLPRKLKKQSTSESLENATLKPKFGLRINNAKVTGLSQKAASTLDLSVRSQGVDLRGRQPVYGRYGLEVHPDNMGYGVVKGGCWEYVPNPIFDSPPSTQASSAPSPDSTSATSDPFEEAKLASETWNRATSIEEKEALSKSPEPSSRSSRRRSSGNSGGVRLALESLDNDIASQRKDIEREHGSQILHGSPADSAVSFHLTHSVPVHNDPSDIVRTGWKGKGRQLDYRDDRAVSAMPGSFPHDVKSTTKDQNVRSKRWSTDCSRNMDDLLPEITSTPNAAMKERFRDQLRRMKELDQEKADREKAAALQIELQRQQEESDRLAAEEADRLAAEEAARLAEEDERQRLRECVACAGKPSSDVSLILNVINF